MSPITQTYLNFQHLYTIFKIFFVINLKKYFLSLKISLANRNTILRGELPVCAFPETAAYAPRLPMRWTMSSVIMSIVYCVLRLGVSESPHPRRSTATTLKHILHNYVVISLYTEIDCDEMLYIYNSIYNWILLSLTFFNLLSFFTVHVLCIWSISCKFLPYIW